MSAQSPSVLIANGVNLDLLGTREPGIYGSQSPGDLEAYLTDKAPKLAGCLGLSGCRLSFFQSNFEGAYLEKLGDDWDGIILNPGAWTHTSLALGDRLAALAVPFVEVHLSAVCQREDFRQRSFSAAHALGVVQGLGFDSYLAGLLALLSHLKTNQS